MIRFRLARMELGAATESPSQALVRSATGEQFSEKARRANTKSLPQGDWNPVHRARNLGFMATRSRLILKRLCSQLFPAVPVDTECSQCV